VQCGASKRDGTSCRATARAGREWCAFHDPELAQSQTRAAKQAAAHARWQGRPKRAPAAPTAPATGVTTAAASPAPVPPAKPPADARELTAYLMRVIVDVREGRLDAKTANAIGFVAGHAKGLIETGELAAQLRDVQELLRVPDSRPDSQSVPASPGSGAGAPAAAPVQPLPDGPGGVLP
jgi:hypothetical protein